MGVDAVRAGMGAGRLIPFVDGIRTGHRLGVRLVDRLAVSKSLIEQAFEPDRTHLGAIPARCTFVDIDISRTLVERNLKVAGVAGDLFNLGQGMKLYIDVPADLDQFRRDNSHGTIIGGKRLVQLGHNTADGR